MMKYKLHVSFGILLFAICSLSAQYSYDYNPESALKKTNVKMEKLLFVENPGDTVIFEKNFYDEETRLVEYLSKENMPIQARVIYHYDEFSNCIREDYYRNHILYQYKDIKIAKDKTIEEYFSIKGKPKGLKKITFFDAKGMKIRSVVKRKGQPNVIRKYSYYPNGNLRKIKEKMGKIKKQEIYNLAGEPMNIIKIDDNYQQFTMLDEETNQKINLTSLTVRDVPEREVISCGLSFKETYKLETWTYLLANGLNDRCELYLDGKLLYEYLFDYEYHESESEIVAEINF